MEEIEKQQLSYAKEIAFLYNANLENIYLAMFNAVKYGKLTFDNLFTILRTIHISTLNEEDAIWLCEFIRRFSREGINAKSSIIELRKIIKNHMEKNGTNTV